VRTLLISDLHLGIGRRHAVLECPRPRERLLAALEGIDRLVLLGDTIELLEGDRARSLEVAGPLLRALGERVEEIVLVPGNHDRPLISRWLRTRRAPLQIDTAVPLEATPVLARVSGWLARAAVSVRYPGVWLGAGVWATHGHYLDRHLLPYSSWGMTRGLLWRPTDERARPEQYERSPRGSARGRRPAWAHLPLELARAATMPAARRHLLRPEMAPLTGSVLGFQMRRASLPALGRVVDRLGVEADTVIFGHVHRLGPLAGDDPAQWRGPAGSPDLYNTGSWIYEPLLLHGACAPHPYWPGGAVLLDDGQPPRAIGLLDDLTAAELHGARRRR